MGLIDSFRMIPIRKIGRQVDDRPSQSAWSPRSTFPQNAPKNVTDLLIAATRSLKGSSTMMFRNLTPTTMSLMLALTACGSAGTGSMKTMDPQTPDDERPGMSG